MTAKLRIIVTISIIYTFVSNSISCVAALERTRDTSVYANIPSKVNIRVFGFTAPNSLVQATSVRVFAQVSSDQSGYFLIDPLAVSQEAKEICLVTIDSEKRVGFPLCISLPEVDKPTEIGPLYLSPTLSLSEKIIWQGQNVIASGVTIPNAEVQISFFEKERYSIAQKLGDSLVKILHPQVLAFELPFIKTVSDRSGLYSVTIPSDRSTSYRLFARSLVENMPTSKSNTLSLFIGSALIYFIIFVLPRFLVLLLIIGGSIWIIQKERKNHRVKAWLVFINEKKLKPFAVRIHLRLVRLSYNLRLFWKLHRK